MKRRNDVAIRTEIVKYIQSEERIDKEMILAYCKLNFGYYFTEIEIILDELERGGLISIGSSVEIEEDWKESKYAERFKKSSKEELLKLFHENKYQRY